MVVGTLKSSRGGAFGALLSPFKGGLNNVGEGATIEDAQVAVLQNFDVDTDGTLVNRPAIENTGSLPPVGGTVTNYQFVTNPAARSNTTGYVAEGSNGSSGITLSSTSQNSQLDTVTGYSGGGNAVRNTASATLTYLGVRWNNGGATQDSSIAGGKTYTLTGYARSNNTTLLLSVFLWFYNSAGAQVGTAQITGQTLTNTFGTRFAVTAVAPAGTTAVAAVFRGVGSVVSGNVIDVALVNITDTSAVAPYMDGNTPSTVANYYDWAGATDASVSRYYNIAADPAPVTPLGYYVRSDGMTFLVAGCGGRTWIFDLTNKVWTRIWGSLASDFAQYDNKIVLISETTSGGYWEAGAFTATNTMPLGSGIVVYNERFWAFGPKGTANSTTIYFSNITGVSPATSIYTWTTATDFFVVDKGDGQWITAIVADPNALLIFRSASTYQFTYPNAPINGSLSLLNSSVGADHRWAVLRYENYYWVLNQGFLYQFISYQFYPRNAQVVRFDPSPMSTRYIDTAISALGDRIIVYYYGNTYAYNVRQQVWSTWTSVYAPGRVLQMPASSSGTGPRKALVFCGYNVGPAARNVLQMTDSPSQTQYAGEDMTCTVRTKTYDFNTAGIFKRMTYWSVGFRSASGITGTAVPVGVNGQSVTFDDMEAYTFDQLDLGGWDAPIIVTPTFVDNITFPASAPVQALARAKAAFRFLSIYYEATLQTKGTPATAPARIFSVTAFLKQHSRTKEKVS